MPIFSNAVKNARLQAVIDAIGTTGKLEIGTAGMALVLATIPLANPAGGAPAAGVLTFTMPQSDVAADASGTPVAARIRTGANVDVVTGLTVGTGGTDVVLNAATITIGQTVSINSFLITHN